MKAHEKGILLIKRKLIIFKSTSMYVELENKIKILYDLAFSVNRGAVKDFELLYSLNLWENKTVSNHLFFLVNLNSI